MVKGKAKAEKEFLMYSKYLNFHHMFPRVGSSMAKLSVVPVRWTHLQEVSHMDTHPASGHFQKVG